MNPSLKGKWKRFIIIFLKLNKKENTHGLYNCKQLEINKGMV